MTLLSLAWLCVWLCVAVAAATLLYGLGWIVVELVKEKWRNRG